MLGVQRETKRGLTLLASDPGAAEIHCALVAAVWGVLLAAPGDTFATSPSYEAMSAIMPEWYWGGALLTLACAGLVGAWRQVYALRRAVALAGVIAWGLIAWLLVISNPLATGGYVYLLTAITHGSTYWRLGVCNGNSQPAR